MSDGIKGLVGRKMSKKFKFMDTDVIINKLSVSQVLEIQSIAKTQDGGEEAGFNLVKKVVSMGVEGGADLTDEDFSTFPLDELSKLSNEVMKFSGVISDDKAGK